VGGAEVVRGGSAGPGGRALHRRARRAPGRPRAARRDGRHPGRTDVGQDAWALASALVAVDGRITDAEVRALITAFAGRVDIPIERATPEEVRRQRLLHGADAWLGAPSALFSLLREADLRDGTVLARTYYDRALSLAHAAVAIDGYTDRFELAAVERFREMLLRLLPPQRGSGPQPPQRGTPGHRGR
jgi:hypothetical protein